jgi:hypothetical protein
MRVTYVYEQQYIQFWFPLRYSKRFKSRFAFCIELIHVAYLQTDSTDRPLDSMLHCVHAASPSLRLIQLHSVMR